MADTGFPILYPGLKGSDVWQTRKNKETLK